MEVERMPKLTGVNKRHTAVKMMLAESASWLRKAQIQEFSQAPSMSSDLPSITTLLPQVGEGRQIWSELRGFGMNWYAVFIFLLAATAGQVDVEDVEDAALHPTVLIAEGLGKRSKRNPPPPEGLDLLASRLLSDVARKHQMSEAPAPLWLPPDPNPPSPLLTTTAGQQERDGKAKGKSQKKEAGHELIDGDPWGGNQRRRLRPLEHLAAPPPPPNAPDLAQKRWCSTPKRRHLAAKPTSTPTRYSGASPSPSPTG
jgi:hypothetical protein